MPPALANAIFDAVGVRVDQIPIQPHMILKALQAKEHGAEARFGPSSFPEVDFGETILVPTPAEGGDGRAASARLHPSSRATDGTMASREEALKGKKDLTTR